MGSTHLITEGKPQGKHAGITYKRGDVIQRFEYAAYGRESFVLNPNLAWDPAFTGQQYDIETGLYYYRARYYNPILGRFIQPDTIVQDSLDPQSWNRYAYVRNNPLKYVDPSGHVIKVVLDHPDREHTVAEDAAGMDWSDAPSFDSVKDIPDGTYGEARIGGVDAFVDFTGSGGSSGQSSDVKSDSVDHAKTGDLARESGTREFSQSVAHEEGGLVGASVVWDKNQDSMVLNPVVAGKMEQAWIDSRDYQQTVQEQGGWIVSKRGSLDVVRWPSGGSGQINVPIVTPGNAVGYFHTHPYAIDEGFVHSPSQADIKVTGMLGMPQFIIDRIGVMRIDIHNPRAYRDVFLWRKE